MRTYFIGRPEISKSGRFGKRVTTYNTCTTDGVEFILSTKSFSSFGKLGIQPDIIYISKTDFNKLIK